ncbi:hypothetical protein D4Q85_00960 [bacterium]|nr:MAG: hypothetical protein D4Q85_00960 [bacterium]
MSNRLVPEQITRSGDVVAATPKPRRFAKTRTLRHTARNARKLIHPPSPQLSAQAKPRNGSRAASPAFALQEWVQRAWRARPFRRGKRAAARLKIGKRESNADHASAVTRELTAEVLASCGAAASLCGGEGEQAPAILIGVR